MNTNSTTFSKQLGLANQAEDLRKWQARLKPECYADLFRRVQQENENLCADSTGFDVFRGDNFLDVILNWSPRPALVAIRPRQGNAHEWLVGKINLRIESAKQELRRQKRKYAGLRVIDFSGQAEVFPKGTSLLSTVIGNLLTQPTDAFKVFTNPNNEVVVQETRKLPFYHLV